MARAVRKRRTREHIIADLNVNHVERQALLCGYTVERMAHDYGIDLELFTFDNKGEVESGQILLQLKASDRLNLRPGQTVFPFRVERRDLVFWTAQPWPVILIVYDAKKHVAYWLYVQSYFRKRTEFNLFAAGKTVTVQVAIQNIVNPNAMRRFSQFRHPVLRQMSEAIHDEGEAD
jgi:hypothetical protein